MKFTSFADPPWKDLPKGMDLVTSEDEVVGFCFDPDESKRPPIEEVNGFLASVGMPLLEDDYLPPLEPAE